VAQFSTTNNSDAISQIEGYWYRKVGEVWNVDKQFGSKDDENAAFDLVAAEDTWLITLEPKDYEEAVELEREKQKYAVSEFLGGMPLLGEISKLRMQRVVEAVKLLTFVRN